LKTDVTQFTGSTPDYEQGISVAGYHLRFINQPRSRGDHCLDYQIDRGEIRISTSSELHLSLPRNAAFLKADVSNVGRPGNLPKGFPAGFLVYAGPP
jgi:acetolactate decarboxylase